MATLEPLPSNPKDRTFGAGADGRGLLARRWNEHGLQRAEGSPDPIGPRIRCDGAFVPGYNPRMQDEAEYICDACGETIVIPVDLTQGRHQQYGEDCPVCCRPHRITLVIEADGSVRASAEPE